MFLSEWLGEEKRSECKSCVACSWIFFFQAEDGIRDGRVTGVQTCALPIFAGAFPFMALRAPQDAAPRSGRARANGPPWQSASGPAAAMLACPSNDPAIRARSEERRVGKERRCRCSCVQLLENCISVVSMIF